MKGFTLGAVLSLGLLGTAPVAGADEEKVPLKDLPKAVVDAVKARFAGAELKEATKEIEDGKTNYEVSIKDGGKEFDLALTADGKLTEIESAIAPKDLPRAVATAISAKYPGSTVKKAEELVVIEGGKETRRYEVVLSKDSTEVVLSAEGKILKESKGDEDDDDKED